ncbi:hypothetical protein O1611_g675 [Lasiodiplodia mahajangana]|uniref:Uncharacterized protein n=1 Tax=Lasiodiplodia mahajangana TaxID=1108764 RepID=A0ACC2JZW8_9PEZI|nr:hypothetical protein O1611_g675 [Lasiodiplodia mahajangana]
MFPPAPQFSGTVRLAKLADIPRVGIVAAASFYHSSWFKYERPYYDKYPLDTLSSYRDSFRKAIRDPDSVVLVVEDSLDRNESEKVYDALARVYPPFEEQIPDEGLRKGKAVVSVAAFSLLPESSRHGQFQPEGPLLTCSCPKWKVNLNLDEGIKLPDDPVQRRDTNQTATENMSKVLHPKEVKTFKHHFVIDMMVTHPAYWRRGHASAITKWYLDLSGMDQVGIGVAGAPMGKVFFSSLGFEESSTVEIPGYPEHPKSVFAWLGLREVENTNSTSTLGVVFTPVDTSTIPIPITITVGVGGKHLANQQEVPAATASQVLSYAGLIAGYFITFGGTASDFSIYHDPKASLRKVFTYIYLGIFTPSVPLLILGAAMGGAVPVVTGWTEAYESYGTGGVMAAMLEPAGGFGKFVLVLLALSVIGNIGISMYPVALNLQMLVPAFTKVPRFLFTLAVTALMIPLSIAASRAWEESLENFLAVIGYWAGFFDAVLIEEVVVFRHLDWESFDHSIWNVGRKLPSGIAALVASLLSLGLVIPGISEVWFVGPLAKTTGDIGFELAFFGTALFYFPLRWLEIKWRGHL